MASPGTYAGHWFGYDSGMLASYVANSGASVTFAMPTANNAWAARFRATSTKDIKSVRLSWSTVTAAGTVDIRIETIDATTGKPTGTLYDANAVLASQAPVAGEQTYTFAVLPTTGLTVGTEYALVVICSGTGTAHTLRSSGTNNPRASCYPTIVLTAADGSTRSNFAEVSTNVPICSFVMEDDSEDPMGCVPLVTTTNNAVYGTNAAAAKIVVPTNVTFEPMGIGYCPTKTGTPAGDLVLKIMDTSGNTVANSTITIDKDSISTGVSNNRAMALFGTAPSLTAGTYYIVATSASSANSSNCWTIRSINAFNAASIPSSGILATTADVTASPPTWTPTTTALAPFWLVQNSITASAGGGTGGCIIGGLDGLAGLGLVGATMAQGTAPTDRRGFFKRLAGAVCLPFVRRGR